VEVAAGEILGIAGVTGNGQELLGRLLAGVARPSSGTILLEGEPVRANMAGSKIAYVPEQPLLNGIAPELSVLENLTATDLRLLPFWLDLSPFRNASLALMERFDVRPRDLDRPAGTLSGGNVQKLVAARELGGAPLLVVACFPTMGLDAAAERVLTNALIDLADRGAAVVWISEDLDALLLHADRIGVLHRGTLRGPIPTREATAVGLGAWMTGEAA
jgi:simple sugar transport system ATP-binding protein